MSDPWSRTDYRRLIAWPARIEREWPLLEEVLATAPAQSILDLGCGTGEHARFLAEKGFRVVGIDSSESMLEQAREAGGTTVAWRTGDLRDLAGLVDEPAGAAICLGNVLPHLTNDEDLSSFIAGLADRLRQGAPFLLQLLNYERIIDQGIRSLPVNVRPGEVEGEEIAFLRLMTVKSPTEILFHPTTLTYCPDREPAVELHSSRTVRLRPWRRDQLEASFRDHGYTMEAAFGTMRSDQPFETDLSPDLVLLARKV